MRRQRATELPPGFVEDENGMVHAEFDENCWCYPRCYSICSRCGGRGQLKLGMPATFPQRFRMLLRRDMAIRCPGCKGTGEVAKGEGARVIRHNTEAFR